MGNEHDVPDAEAVTVVGAAPRVAPPEPTTPTTTVAGPVDRVRTALAATTARQVLGWALVIGWVLWLTATWVAQPRLVPQGFLADDLAQGRVTGYRVVTTDEGTGPGPYRLDVSLASDGQDGVVDGASDGRPVTVAYWVDAPVAAARVLDTNGLSSDTTTAVVARFTAAGVSSDTTTAVVARFTAAGVPEADAGILYRGMPADRIHQAGALLLFLSSLVVVLGPRPRRGTRWFWFWCVGGPLSVGVLVFAVAELLRPRYEPEGTVPPPGVAGRWSGLAGFAITSVGSLVVAWGLLALSGISPIWFIRG